MKLNKQAYDEFLRHVTIDASIARFQTFVDAHRIAASWFIDFRHDWHSDDRVTAASSASKEDQVAAMRLLSLYTWVWSVGLKPPPQIYRSHLSLEKLRIGSRVSFSGVGSRYVSSWTTRSSFQLSPAESVQRDLGLKGSRFFRYCFKINSPRRENIVFMPYTLMVLEGAQEHLLSLIRAAQADRNASSGVQRRLNAVLDAVVFLHKTIRVRDYEAEVIMYTKTPVIVQVLED